MTTTTVINISSAPTPVLASALRVGDEIKQVIAGVTRWLKVTRVRNTPEHVRFETSRGDMIMAPGMPVAIRRAPRQR